MIRFIVLTVIVIGLFIGSCDDSVTNTGDNEIMPLSNNNKWYGSLVSYDYDHYVIDSVNYVFWLNESVAIDSGDWYRLKYIYDNTDTTEAGFLLYAGDAGLWSRHDCSPTPCLAYMYAKYPALKNDTYDTHDSFYPHCRVKSVDTTITVPAGTFTCNAYLMYDNTFFENYIIYYLAPNIGYVKMEKYGPNPVDAPYIEETWFLEFYQVR